MLKSICKVIEEFCESRFIAVTRTCSVGKRLQSQTKLFEIDKLYIIKFS